MWTDLVCPVDRGELDANDDWLSCRSCGRGYPVIDGIPTFLEVDEDDQWLAAQRTRLARLSQSGETGSSVDVRRRGRELEAQLAKFIRLSPQTRILQVGLDGEGELHHFRTGVRYAVEPLAGALAERHRLKWGSVRWIAGSGEQLPFADRQLDAVLLTEVLEYAPSPARVLSEAYRCLADHGVLWISSCVTSQPASKARRQLTSGRIASACRKAYLSLQWSAKLAPARRDFVLRPQARALSRAA